MNSRVDSRDSLWREHEELLRSVPGVGKLAPPGNQCFEHFGIVHWLTCIEALKISHQVHYSLCHEDNCKRQGEAGDPKYR